MTASVTDPIPYDAEGFPEERPREEGRYEQIQGTTYVSPNPRPQHARVIRRLLRALADHARVHGGEAFTGVNIFLDRNPKGDYVAPDVLFLAAIHRDLIHRRGIMGPPDLVVEVLSPSNRATDLRRKRRLYARAGVAEYWIVDDDARRVEVYTDPGSAGYGKPTLVEPGGQLRSVAVPGLVLAMSALLESDPTGHPPS
jgi:Uma2 family endonuclease